jgi:hypothetical protein
MIASDLGEFMSYIQEQYRGQNVGAVIMASDGAYNRGKNPLYVADLKAPFSVIALGDTVRKTDLCQGCLSQQHRLPVTSSPSRLIYPP